MEPIKDLAGRKPAIHVRQYWTTVRAEDNVVRATACCGNASRSLSGCAVVHFARIHGGHFNRDFDSVPRRLQLRRCMEIRICLPGELHQY
jgi:hypothetical protein